MTGPAHIVIKERASFDNSRAACAGKDPDLFYPEEENEASTVIARQICSSCPVREECLHHAIRWKEEDGIWGGLNSRERFNLGRRLRRRAVVTALVSELESTTCPVMTSTMLAGNTSGPLVSS